MLTETIQHFYNERREHLEQLLREFERLGNESPEERRRIFEEFRAGLEHQMNSEEKLLYPVLERLAGKDEWGLELMRCEHEAIRGQLARLEWMLEQPGKQAGLAEVALRDIMQPHCAKEELVLYPMLDQFLSHAERSALLAEVFVHSEALEGVAEES